MNISAFMMFFYIGPLTNFDFAASVKLQVKCWLCRLSFLMLNELDFDCRNTKGLNEIVL
jgi:hypothetical protein